MKMEYLILSSFLKNKYSNDNDNDDDWCENN